MLRDKGATRAVRGDPSQAVRLFLVTGILGGFTTFSALSLDAALMWQRSDHVALAVYVAGPAGISIAAGFLGMATIRPLA